MPVRRIRYCTTGLTTRGGQHVFQANHLTGRAGGGRSLRIERRHRALTLQQPTGRFLTCRVCGITSYGQRTCVANASSQRDPNLTAIAIAQANRDALAYLDTPAQRNALPDDDASPFANANYHSYSQAFANQDISTGGYCADSTGGWSPTRQWRRA